MSPKPQAYFESRLPHGPRRETLWRALYAYHFSRLISAEDCVLDWAAAMATLLNQVVSRKRIALDQWEGFIDYLRPGVEGRVGDVAELSFIAPSSVNFAFASNLFEHITQKEFRSSPVPTQNRRRQRAAR